jgi:hypothetical protein
VLHLRDAQDPQKVALFPEGDLAPEIEEMFKAGSFWLHFCEPDPRRFKLAALKHAYLAACLYLGYVPNFTEADQIRADLLAARDTPRRLPPPPSTYAERLSLYRSERPPQGPPLAIMVTRPNDLEENPEYLISLAGTLLVSWPFSIVPPSKHFQMVPMFG